MSKENNGWISIEEQHPNIGQEALVLLDNQVRIAIYHGEFAIDFHWIDGAEFNADWKHCKYWQPLPEPPKE